MNEWIFDPTCGRFTRTISYLYHPPQQLTLILNYSCILRNVHKRFQHHRRRISLNCVCVFIICVPNWMPLPKYHDRLSVCPRHSIINHIKFCQHAPGHHVSPVQNVTSNPIHSVINSLCHSLFSTVWFIGLRSRLWLEDKGVGLSTVWYFM